MRSSLKVEASPSKDLCGREMALLLREVGRQDHEPPCGTFLNTANLATPHYLGCTGLEVPSLRDLGKA